MVQVPHKTVKGYKRKNKTIKKHQSKKPLTQMTVKQLHREYNYLLNASEHKITSKKKLIKAIYYRRHELETISRFGSY